MIYNILTEKEFLEKMSEKWEPLLNNLGHVYRKLGDYNEAIHYFNEALYLVPNNSSTLDSIGLVYSLMDEPQMACDYFEKVKFLDFETNSETNHCSFFSGSHLA